MSSPYSRFGGTSMYGSNYGGMYGMGGYGMGGYGMGGFGGMYGGMGGMYGQQPNPNDPNSMTQNFAQSTQATFQIIESIVGAFGGFAQMLESTYMATQSSFFAMVNVAEQFGNLRQTLGSVLGIYAVLRWIRTLIARLTGRPPPADATALTPSSFAQFMGKTDSNLPPGMTVGPDGRPIPKPSKKPFIVFILAVFGLPYLMGKLIRALARSTESQTEIGQIPGTMIGPDGQPLPMHMQPPQLQAQIQAQQQQQAQSKSLDPTKLDFCRVLYDFPPPEAVKNGSFNTTVDLTVKEGDLVAVLDKTDPDGIPQKNNESQWWRCRARDGRMGYLPAVYLKTIERKPPQQQIANAAAADGSRANSMPSTLDAVETKSGVKKVSPPQSRAQTITGNARSNTTDASKAQNAESFQKAWGTGQ